MFVGLGAPRAPRYAEAQTLVVAHQGGVYCVAHYLGGIIFISIIIFFILTAVVSRILTSTGKRNHETVISYNIQTFKKFIKHLS